MVYAYESGTLQHVAHIPTISGTYLQDRCRFSSMNSALSSRQNGIYIQEKRRLDTCKVPFIQNFLLLFRSDVWTHQ